MFPILTSGRPPKVSCKNLHAQGLVAWCIGQLARCIRKVRCIGLHFSVQKYTGMAHREVVVHWSYGVVHRAAKLVSLQNSLKLLKLFTHPIVHVSYDLSIASKSVFHKVYGDFLKEKLNPTFLTFPKKLLPIRASLGFALVVVASKYIFPFLHLFTPSLLHSFSLTLFLPLSKLSYS